MTSGAISASAACTLSGAALLYLSMAASRDRRKASRPHDRATRWTGILATLNGCTLAVVSRGWGVGLMSFAVLLMLALSLLALAVPLWPRSAWGVVGIVVTALLAHALSGA